MNISVCGLTRLVVPAFFVGFTAAVWTGRDVVGWVVAAAVAAGLYGWGRFRGTSVSCPVPTAAGRSTPSVAESDADVRHDATGTATGVDTVTDREGSLP
ncbi:MAG TPA: hypothetical protein PKA87_00790 [Microthrixaceae bacterium]|nr:hypothetical protein [Microthrixaceae bacterium]MCB9374785.1 hypothetical protein [Microthrixaceae bacterium]MCB9400836.1 hypothetical protein [Microthrixaceae bacterium]HMU78840.1 hypothetical protein [Microthrixaceae bacterium]HMV73075.1 hypothetical protein [Microthrixaceae bacterium]